MGETKERIRGDRETSTVQREREGKGKGYCAVTTVSYTPPAESWFSLKPYSIFDAERGTAPHPIGQTAVNDITATYI